MAVKEQIKSIYALGAVCGMVEQNNKDDNLHRLVYSMTGKDSVSRLSDNEVEQVKAELKKRLPKTQEPEIPAQITKEQISLAFRLIHRLEELDETPSKATTKERLAGVIKKSLKIEVDTRYDIFKNTTYQQGIKLINTLKRYVRTAEKRAERSKNESS